METRFYERIFRAAKLDAVALLVRILGCRACGCLIAGIALGIVLAASAARAEQMAVSSPAFEPGARIPAQFTCTGSDFSPELKWTRVPSGTKSLALVVEDPDAPSGTFIHWVLFNLPAGSMGIPDGQPASPSLPNGARQGVNGFGTFGYKGPCPPPGPVHHYHFILFALDAMVDPGGEADATALRSAMEGHIKASAELVGTFSR